MSAWKDGDHVDTNTLIDYVDGLLDDPVREQVSAHLAVCGACQRRTDEARRFSSLWKRWKLRGRSKAFWIARADRYEESGDREGAIAALNEALQIHRLENDPSSLEEAEILLRLARLEAGNRGSRAAEAYLKEAIQIQEEGMARAQRSRIAGMNSLVSLYLEREELESAEEWMDKIEEILPPAIAPEKMRSGSPEAGLGSEEQSVESTSELSAAALQQSIRDWLKRETRSDVRELLLNLVADFKQGIHGAFRVVTENRILALDRVGEFLNPEKHWLFGYAETGPRDEDIPDSFAQQRKIHGVWIREGQKVPAFELDATLNEKQGQVLLNLSQMGQFSEIIVYEFTRSTGTWNATKYRPGDQREGIVISGPAEKVVFLSVPRTK